MVMLPYNIFLKISQIKLQKIWIYGVIWCYMVLYSNLEIVKITI